MTSEAPSHRPRLAIVIPDYSVTKSVTTINTALLFADAGYEVEILTNGSVAGAPLRPGVEFLSSLPGPSSNAGSAGTAPLAASATAGWGRLFSRWPRILEILTRVRALKWRLSSFCAFVLFAARRCRARPPVCVIGADPNGLMAAAIVASVARARLVYLSLELYTWRECSGAGDYMVKACEALLQRFCAFTLIQDVDRANVMRSENRMGRHRFLFMPVAGLGPVIEQKSDFLRDRFGIPRGKKILLHAGGVFPWNRCLEIAESAVRLPDDWVVVIHGFPHDPEYVIPLRCAGPPDRLILSLEPVPFDTMGEVIASADIGMVLYENRGPNYLHIANSSNRLVDYLQHGLPVIVCNFPSLRAMVENHGCGKVLADDGNIAELVREIDADYARYAEAARRCYVERYDARKYFPPILEAVREIRRR
jgi:glycosyltransferase involved in cell wall biosynthesis